MQTTFGEVARRLERLLVGYMKPAGIFCKLQVAGNKASDELVGIRCVVKGYQQCRVDVECQRPCPTLVFECFIQYIVTST